MKFLIVLACAFAAASAGYIAAPLATVYQAQHLPVIGHDGVPVDTAEVQHARAAHLAHKIEAHARNGDYAVYAHHAPAVYAAQHVAAPVVPAYAAHHVAAPVVSAYAANHVAAYPTTAVLPASVNGVPLDTPEVAAAKVNHYAAHAEALARNGDLHHHAVLLRKRRGLVAAPLAYSAYTPYAYSAYQTPYLATSYANSYSHSYAHPYAYSPYAHYY